MVGETGGWTFFNYQNMAFDVRALDEDDVVAGVISKTNSDAFGYIEMSELITDEPAAGDIYTVRMRVKSTGSHKVDNFTVGFGSRFLAGTGQGQQNTWVYNWSDSFEGGEDWVEIITSYQIQQAEADIGMRLQLLFAFEADGDDVEVYFTDIQVFRKDGELEGESPNVTNANFNQPRLPEESFSRGSYGWYAFQGVEVSGQRSLLGIDSWLLSPAGNQTLRLVRPPHGETMIASAPIRLDSDDTQWVVEFDAQHYGEPVGSSWLRLVSGEVDPTFGMLGTEFERFTYERGHGEWAHNAFCFEVDRDELDAIAFIINASNPQSNTEEVSFADFVVRPAEGDECVAPE